MRFTGRYEGYSVENLRKDLISGLIVGIIAIPLGMAFAIASGVQPAYGIYTTIVAGILISLFGGSRYQIGGPTGAFIPILFAIVMQYGYENLLIAGLLAGIILVLMGVFKLGALIRYIPKPVVIGFTSGIAVIIFSGQIGNFLGLTGLEKHEYFLDNMKEIGIHIQSTSIYSIITALICLAILILMPKVWPKVPASLFGLIISSVVATLFFNGEVATIGSTYGAIPNSLPSFHIPDITWEKITMLIKPALIIAMLGGIESLLSAVVADGMTGSRHNSNRELIGQGIANIVTPLFGGIPATGAIARTATNIKSGAFSPISGIVHGVVVLIVLVLFAPFASSIPLASIAPILMLVAWNMSERKEFMHLLKTKTSDSLVLIITFLLTVLTDITLAVEVGLVLAMILFVKRMSDITKVAKVLPDPTVKHEKVLPHMVSDGHDCPQIRICTIEGALFFGAASSFEFSIMKIIKQNPKVLLIRMGKVPFMDTSGEAELHKIIKHVQNHNGTVLISSLQNQPKEILQSTGAFALIGEENCFEHTGDALDYALTCLDTNKCLTCKHFVFRECKSLSKEEYTG